MLLDPALAAPEMYMDGRLVLDEGDVYDLIALAKSNTRPEVSTPGAWVQHLRRSITSAPILRAIGVKAARANVAHHYDLDERLYRLFLDGDMQYSCAYFERPDMTLDQAQLAKKRLIAAKLLIRPGARVLDIGCGWGGMALYLARVCGADVTGITLSQEQHRVATERAAAAGLADRVRFRLQDYREVDETLRQHRLGRHVRACRPAPVPDLSSAPPSGCSTPDGVMLLHSMAQPTPAPYNQPFMEKYIFPGGYIPSLSEVLPAVEKSGLLIRDTEILSLHYAETTREWRRRFLANRDEVLALYDERFIRMWEFYLAGAESRLPLRRDARRPPAARPRSGPRAADPRLHPRGDGPARRGRARLPRLRLAARRAAGRSRGAAAAPPPDRPRPGRRPALRAGRHPMTIFRVRHVTTYRYRRAGALRRAPADVPAARQLRPAPARAPSSTSIPAPASVRWMHDVFGNCVAQVAIPGKARELRFETLIRLEHTPAGRARLQDRRRRPRPIPSPTIPTRRPISPRRSGGTTPTREVEAWARHSSGPGRRTETGTPADDACYAIHESFVYTRRSEPGTQPPRSRCSSAAAPAATSRC